jgi:hypothetical protein
MVKKLLPETTPYIGTVSWYVRYDAAAVMPVKRLITGYHKNNFFIFCVYFFTYIYYNTVLLKFKQFNVKNIKISIFNKVSFPFLLKIP